MQIWVRRRSCLGNLCQNPSVIRISPLGQSPSIQDHAAHSRHRLHITPEWAHSFFIVSAPGKGLGIELEDKPPIEPALPALEGAPAHCRLCIAKAAETAA